MKVSVKVVFVVLLSFVSCQCIIAQDKKSIGGNGTIVEKSIPIEDYTNIHFDANADLIYELRSDTASSIKLEVDENLLPFIEVIVKKKKLQIKTVGTIRPTKFVIYTNSRIIEDIDMVGAGNVFIPKHLNTKNLNVELEGFGTFKANDLLAKSISIDVSGAGSASLKGITQSLSLEIDKKASGSINCEELQAESVNCDIHGSGNMIVNASNSLNVKIDGSGNVLYKGSPRTFSHKLKGTGSVKQVPVEAK
ncbi:MAG: hypothetical protein RL662_1633 [Bacteroidota bacterium]|jgi:hypothetical protein